jgi:hypothetical protein
MFGGINNAYDLAFLLHHNRLFAHINEETLDRRGSLTKVNGAQTACHDGACLQVGMGNKGIDAVWVRTLATAQLYRTTTTRE